MKFLTIILITSARSRDAQEWQKSVQWGLLPICVKYTLTRGTDVYLVFILPDPNSPNRNSQLNENASIDAGFLKKEPFGVSRFAKMLLGVISAPKNGKKINCCKTDVLCQTAHRPSADDK
jgi:hypothetical protein